MMNKSKAILTSIFLLFSFGQATFYEGNISLPEDSPGLMALNNIVYNWVNNKLYLSTWDNGMAILDGQTLKTIKRIDLMVEAGGLVWLPQTNRLYFPVEIPASIVVGKRFLVMDGESDSIIDTLPFDRNRNGGQLLYNENNGLLYAIEYFSDPNPNGQIVVFDGITNHRLDTIRTVGIPCYLTLSLLNNHLYVASRSPFSYPDSHYFRLNIIDCRANQIIDTTIKGMLLGPTNSITWLLYNQNLNKLYFNAYSEILVIDCQNDSVVKRLEIRGCEDFLFNYRNNKIYIPNSSSIKVINCLSDSVFEIMPHRTSWYGAYNSRENKVYFITPIDTIRTAIVIIDGESDSIITELPMERHCYKLYYDSVNNRVYTFRDEPRPELLVIDGVNNQITDTIVCGEFLTSGGIWNPINNRLYIGVVRNYWFNPAILVIDGETHHFLKYIPVDFDELCYFTINSRRNKVYASGWADGVVLVISGERDTLLNVINLGSSAGALAYNPVNDKIYCANYENGVAVIDGLGDTLLASIWVPFLPFYGIIWCPGLNKVYFGAPGWLGVIDGETNRLLRTVRGPNYIPLEFVYNRWNNKLYIAYADRWGLGGGLGIFDCLSDTFTKFIFDSHGIYGVALSEEENKVYFSYITNIGVLDVETESIIRIISPQPYPRYFGGMIWYPEGNKIFCNATGGFCIVDCETDSILEITALRRENQGIILNQKNDRLYLLAEERSRILVFRGEESGIKEKTHSGIKPNLRVSPNPAKGFINISKKGEKGRIKIFDALGRMVKELSLPEGGENIIQWNGDSNSGRRISPGIYFLRLERKRKIYTQKIIWQE